MPLTDAPGKARALYEARRDRIAIVDGQPVPSEIGREIATFATWWRRLVTDPIDGAFDEAGRMYVVEMNDYPFLPEQRVQKYRDQRPETWGRIRLLTDTDEFKRR